MSSVGFSDAGARHFEARLNRPENRGASRIKLEIDQMHTLAYRGA